MGGLTLTSTLIHMRLINGCTVTLLAKSTEQISCKTHHTSHWNCSVLWCWRTLHSSDKHSQLWIYHKTHFSKLDRLQNNRKYWHHRKHINKPVSRHKDYNKTSKIFIWSCLTQTVLRATGCSATSPGPWAGDQNVGWSRHTERKQQSHLSPSSTKFK